MSFLHQGRDDAIGYGTSERGAGLDFAWKGKLQMGLLIDEPVISQQFQYVIGDGLVTLPILGGVDEHYETVRFGALPDRYQNYVRLYDVQIRHLFEVPGRGKVELVTNAGSTGWNGEWAFNVPGSPEWDRLFRRKGGDWLSADAAREVWQANPALVSSTIENARLSLWTLHFRYAKDHDRVGYDALRSALDRVEDGLSRSYGLKAPNRPDEASLVADWRDLETVSGMLSEATWSEMTDAAKAWLDRLEAMPPRFAQGDNHAPFRTAMADARLVFERTQDQRENWTPRGLNIDNIPSGYAPTFMSKEQHEEQQRIDDIAQNFEPIFDRLAATSVSLKSCGSLPGTPVRDERAVFDAFDSRMNDIKSCLNLTSANLQDQLVEIRGLNTRLEHIIEAVAPSLSADEFETIARAVDHQAVRLNSEIAAARTQIDAANAAWDAAAAARNRSLQNLYSVREQRRAERRAAKLAEENRRREAALDRAQREADAQALVWGLTQMQRSVSNGDPLQDPNSEFWQGIRARAATGEYTGVSSSATHRSGSGIVSGDTRSFAYPEFCVSNAPAGHENPCTEADEKRWRRAEAEEKARLERATRGKCKEGCPAAAQ
ncbi:hypothetical protein [Roseovarius sp. S4756]|uniref:hypothetical protein n=1 Tax=Roseovarius maritimus TaxID=3342637 RepID=UPI003B671BD9